MNRWRDSDEYARQATKVESAGEALLLTLLWWRRDGWTIRTQQPIGTFRVDLFVPEAKLAIEVDSFEAHGSGAVMERDAKKRNLVVAQGWAPLTFSARQTLYHPHDTLAAALAEVGRRLPAKSRSGVGRAALPLTPLTPEDAVIHGKALLDVISKVEFGEGPPPVIRGRP